MEHPREPVEHTCPDIDKIVKVIDKIYGLLRGHEKIDEISELKDILGDIESDLWNFTDILEELRNSNDSLRQWGLVEAKERDELYEQLEEIEETKLLTP